MLRVLDELSGRLNLVGLPGRRLARATATARTKAWTPYCTTALLMYGLTALYDGDTGILHHCSWYWLSQSLGELLGQLRPNFGGQLWVGLELTEEGTQDCCSWDARHTEILGRISAPVYQVPMKDRCEI